MIHELGLENFYALRDQSNRFAETSIGKRDRQNARHSVLDDLESAGVQVQSMSDGLCRVRLSIDGVHCAACSWLIERIQPTIAGLHSAQLRMSDHTLELIYDPGATHPGDVSRSLAKLGYFLSPVANDQQVSEGSLQMQREHWIGIACAAFFAANAMWIGVAIYAGESTGIQPSHENLLRWVGMLLAVFATLIPGRIFLKTAWNAIALRTAHVDIPIALSLLIGMIGTVVSTIRGHGQVYFDSLASLVLLLRIGRFIQFRSQLRTSRSISRWTRTTQSVATKLTPDGILKRLPSHRLAVGDIVVVEPGEMIPADGLVEDPSLYKTLGLLPHQQIVRPDFPSTVDCSLLNGETKPVTVHFGDKVIGGTTNLTSPLIVRVTASGERSRVGRLMEMVRHATEHRTPWMMAADRVGKWFVVAVLVIALITWCTWAMLADPWTATQHTVALLTIACPCALALAAPIVLTVAMGRAAKQGIWIRDGNCLEKLAKPGTIWFDKTGTLTRGRMKVLCWHGHDGWLPFARALEERVHHPIATAIVEHVPVFDSSDSDSTESTDLNVELLSCQGNGIRGQMGAHLVLLGNQRWMDANCIFYEKTWGDLQMSLMVEGQTAVWMAIDRRVVGMFGLGDPLRDDVAETLFAIQSSGWKLGILSGDRQGIVDAVAKSLALKGIVWTAAIGDQSPESKLKWIQNSKHDDSGPIAMVGDGINDSAALAAADVGIAMRGGCEQSLHAAPVYIASGRLSSVYDLLKASKGVLRGIHACFAASLLYNVSMISLAVIGWVHPLIAAILMPISGITVLTMAIRTKSFQDRGNK
jgi:P-type Cu2+ transporter